MRALRVLGLLLALALAPGAAAQDPVPPGATRELPEWLPLDEVAIVVNSDIVTRKQIEKELRRALAREEITTQQQLDALLNKVQGDAVEGLLIRQAGEDLGFPEEAVEAHIRSQLESRKDEAGGAFELSNQLREEGETATAIRDEIRDEVYEVSWRRRIAGYGDPGERSPEDRYVRPGKLAQRYRRIARTGQDIGALIRVGASPALYQLQVLLLSPRTYGSLEAAREAAEEAARALESGQADWDDLVESIGAMENQGVLPELDVDRIRFALDPGNGALVQFVMEGRTGVLSPLLPYPVPNPSTGQRAVGGFALYKLLGRTPAVLPAYDGEGVQRDLRRVMENEGDQARWEGAIAELEAVAYIWYPGIEEQRAAVRARREERLAEIQAARERNAAILRRRREEAPEAPAPAPDAPPEGP
jgi:hypothetical protein